jgi:hypothetical protein
MVNEDAETDEYRNTTIRWRIPSNPVLTCGACQPRRLRGEADEQLGQRSFMCQTPHLCAYYIGKYEDCVVCAP